MEKLRNSVVPVECAEGLRGVTDSEMRHSVRERLGGLESSPDQPHPMADEKASPGTNSSPVPLHSPPNGTGSNSLEEQSPEADPRTLAPCLHLSWLLNSASWLSFHFAVSFSLFPWISSFLLICFKWYLNKAGNVSMKYVKNTFPANMY